MIFKKLNAPKLKENLPYPSKIFKESRVLNKDLTLVHMNNLSNEDKSIIKKSIKNRFMSQKQPLNEKLPDLKFF